MTGFPDPFETDEVDVFSPCPPAFLLKPFESPEVTKYLLPKAALVAAIQERAVVGFVASSAEPALKLFFASHEILEQPLPWRQLIVAPVSPDENTSALRYFSS